MENAAFNDRFLVTAENAEEAYYILTPHMMEYISAWPARAAAMFYLSFLRGGKSHCGPDRKGLLRIGQERGKGG